MLIFQDIINCVQAIPQIPEKKLCVCFIKTTYLLLDVMICVLLQNVLLLTLNWRKNQYFLLAVIYKSKSKLQMNLKTFAQVFTSYYQNRPYINVLLGCYWRF